MLKYTVLSSLIYIMSYYELTFAQTFYHTTVGRNKVVSNKVVVQISMVNNVSASSAHKKQSKEIHIFTSLTTHFFY